MKKYWIRLMLMLGMIGQVIINDIDYLKKIQERYGE